MKLATNIRTNATDYHSRRLQKTDAIFKKWRSMHFVTVQKREECEKAPAVKFRNYKLQLTYLKEWKCRKVCQVHRNVSHVEVYVIPDSTTENRQYL